MRLGKLLIAALLATGCYGSGAAYIAYDQPPPPREEIVVFRPGFVWVHGQWQRDNDRWRWRSGYYERERPGYVFVEGRWERQGNTYVWIDGAWRGRGHVVIR